MAKKKFTVECEMSERWVPYFLGMLSSMQSLGNMGGSRLVAIYADGDGDYHPKFSWPEDMPEPAKPSIGGGGDLFFDAG